MGDPVAEAQAEEVGGGEVARERGVAGVVEGEKQVDAAAGEGEAGKAGVDAGVLDGVGEGAVGPAVEGDVGQRGGDHRGAGGGEVVVFRPAGLARIVAAVVLLRTGFGHGVRIPHF